MKKDLHGPPRTSTEMQEVSECQQRCLVERLRIDESFIFVGTGFTSSGILQKNVLWQRVKVGLESQKFKGYAAILPSIQCDSQFPVSDTLFFLFMCL